jgi:hypothetical protein
MYYWIVNSKPVATDSPFLIEENGDSIKSINKETYDFAVKVSEAVDNAIATRGKNKGQLKAKCPPVNTPAAAAWLAMMSIANPYKVGMAQMLFMDADNRKVYEAVKSACEKVDQVVNLDSDRAALEAAGVW